MSLAKVRSIVAQTGLLPAALRQGKKGGSQIGCKLRDVVSAFAKKFFESSGGTIAQRKADYLGWCATEEAQVMEILIL